MNLTSPSPSKSRDPGTPQGPADIKVPRNDPCALPGSYKMRAGEGRLGDIPVSTLHRAVRICPARLSPFLHKISSNKGFSG